MSKNSHIAEIIGENIYLELLDPKSFNKNEFWIEFMKKENEIREKMNKENINDYIILFEKIHEEGYIIRTHINSTKAEALQWAIRSTFDRRFDDGLENRKFFVSLNPKYIKQEVWYYLHKDF